MEKHLINLPWGEDMIPLELPSNWNLAGVMEPSPLPGVPNVLEETRRSLQSPIGIKSLAEWVTPESKIALVIDDDSRPTPVSSILPAILEEVQRGGASLSQITVVPAIGVHRSMPEDEIARRIGPQWMGKINWESQDCDNPDRLLSLGTTSRGTPVEINKTVATADLVISLGCIEPHIIASFGGGYKNLVPGVASRATIAHNHALNCQPETFNMVGQPIDNNPMRLDLEEAASMVKGQVFIINAVLNSKLEVVRIVSGDPIKAHREGTLISEQIFGCKIPKLADVVITSSFPMDQDLRQGVKALANNIRALKPGGTMITLIKAEEGVGVFGLANRKLPVGRNALKLLAPLFLPLVPKLNIKGMGEEDRFFLYFALQAMRHGTLLVYGPTIPEEIHERLPFVQFSPSVEAAIQHTQNRFRKQADVLVFPYGGSSYPILPGSSS